MSDATQWIAQIEAHKAEIRAALPAADFRAFEQRCYALTDALTGGEDPQRVAADLRNLLEAYPAAAAQLSLAPVEPAEPTEATEPVEGIPPAQPVLPVAAPPEPPTPTPQGVPPMSDIRPDPRPTPARDSKAESFVLVFKEVVTAIIAVLIALTTLMLVINLVPMLGDSAKMTQGKELLSVLTGLFGVVLGYYFGRIPADARAAQAQEQAARATQQGEQAAARSEMVSAQAEDLADQAREMVAQLQSGPTPRGAGGVNVSEELKQWADAVDDLRRMARSR